MRTQDTLAQSPKVLANNSVEGVLIVKVSLYKKSVDNGLLALVLSSQPDLVNKIDNA